MTNLYVATRVITFFGTYMRTFWEHIVCRICRIPAEDVRAFKSSEMCGHVEHELLETRGQVFLMCWLPLTMNAFIGSCFLLTGSYRIFYIGDYKTLSAYFFLWLGISLFANCVPSFEDVLSFKDVIYGGKNTVLKVILAPLFAVEYGCAVLEKYSLTFILAVAAAVLYPNIFSVFFPILNDFMQMLK